MAQIDANSFARITVPAAAPRPAARHSKIEHVRDDIYMVRGRMPSTPARSFV